MAISKAPTPTELENHPVVSRQEWLDARKDLLVREKEHTLRSAELAKQRRQLPWVEVRKDYRFETPAGAQSLADLFDGRSQLVVYHFMFGPGWEEGCSGCSFVSDHFDGMNLHLSQRDVSLVAVARAPLTDFQSFKDRMGWKFPWVSSQGSDFNFDFGVASTPEERKTGQAQYNYEPLEPEETCDDLPGISVFYQKTSGKVFHSYSSFARGLEHLAGTLQLLDLTPKGRNETSTMNWVRLHDRYDHSD